MKLSPGTTKLVAKSGRRLPKKGPAFVQCFLNASTHTRLQRSTAQMVMRDATTLFQRADDRQARRIDFAEAALNAARRFAKKIRQ